MEQYNTLEEVKAGIQSSLFAADTITLRPEQRRAIDLAKEHFCKRSGKKDNYQYDVTDKYSQFLWNAKMRFGKTLCALQLAREMGVKRTLIVTHRPVVNASWKEDFKNVVGTKVKGNTDLSNHYDYGTLVDDEQHNKLKFYDLEKFLKQSPNNHYVFFVSMQYLRLSELVNKKTQEKHDSGTSGHSAQKENEKLKADILRTDWDLVVIDEAHEGTRTALGKRVIDEFLKKEHTKMLHLSGTPFNLYEDFKDEEIYTWDYISEQKAKREWTPSEEFPNNPYEELPQMKIFMYDITKNIDTVFDQQGIFSFSEFFRTWTGNPRADRATMPDGHKGSFVHEDEVQKFLELLCKKDAENNFPFSTVEYRKMFRHTLWVVEHVDEARALAELLRNHRIFSHFDIINVAGQGDEDEKQQMDALEKVKKSIGDLPEKTSTITISCGRLTTGVTVKPWTAVLYMKGGDNPATYMQTIFRVQSPYKTPEGKMKTTCCVFDFAPDRTLKVAAATAKFSSLTKNKQSKQNKKKNDDEPELTQEQQDKQTVQDFVDLCPLISMDGGQMRELEVETIYAKLENAFIDRLVRKGFDDPCLYVQEELNKLDKDLINDIGKRGGEAPNEKRTEAGESIDLSHMTPEQRKAYEEMKRQKEAEARERAKKKAQKDAEFKAKWESMTEEEREKWLKTEQERLAHLEQLRQAREEFKKRVSNIQGIARRIPLLMYGGADAGDPNDDITVDNFTRKIKDESWAEFMPKDITKEDFNKIRRCFNATRFEEAGKKYRALTREADFMHVDERIQRIAEIFSYFRNPDKETVLTPWRVVNMHLSDTLGGYCFYDDTFDEETGQLPTPRYVDQGDVTRQLFDTVDLGGEVPTKILEINSKTGLYPLYVTYSLYRRRLKEYVKAECIDESTISVQEEQVVWDDIVADNVYVICNTPMAAGITRRTLFGFRPVERKANIKNVQLIERATKDADALVRDLKSVGFWKGNTSKQEMKFNAVVGNPPYQEKKDSELTVNNGAFATALYPSFIDLSVAVCSQYISLITPSRWMTRVGQGITDAWVDKMLKGNHFLRMNDFLDATACFEKVEIKGGVNYFLYKSNYVGECEYSLNQNGKTITLNTYLDPIGSGIVIRDSMALKIIYKVMDVEGNYFNDNSFVPMVSPKHYFDKGELLSSNWKGFVNDKDEEHPIKLYVNKRLDDRGFGWIKNSEVPKCQATIPLNKIYIPKSGGSGTDAMVLGKPFYGEPNSVCSYTYLVIGYNPDTHKFTKEECMNIITYIKTRFFRYMVSIKKKTQDNPRDVFQFVPLQDFSKPWTDEELYDKYGLDLFEREYIESLIKPMD